MDTQWLAIREAAIPGLIGVAVFISAHIRHPLVQVLLYTPTLMNADLIQESPDARGNRAAFNEELGRLTLMSYPMIAVPSMLIMMAVMYYLARSIRTLAGLKPTEVIVQ